MTVSSFAVARAKFLFGMWGCGVDSDVGTGNFSFVLGILHTCGHGHMWSHMHGLVTTTKRNSIAWEVQRMQKIHDSMCEKVCLQTMIILTALEVNKTLRYKWHYKTNSKYQ